MKLRHFLALAAVAAGVAIAYQQFQQHAATVQLPSDIDLNAYWGRTPAAPTTPASNETRLMEIRYQDAPIERLRQKLAEPFDMSGLLINRRLGGNFLKEFITYWRDEYLLYWRSREVLFNRMPQFQTNIQGLDLHYFHTCATYAIGNKTRTPILLLHGWPGTPRDFYDLAARLADPSADAQLGDIVFEVVAPSLPGYAFSPAPEAADGRRQLSVADVAVLVRNLMRRLGYERFYVHGSHADGARVAAAVATIFPLEVIGLHSCGCEAPPTLVAAIKGWVAEWLPIGGAPNGWSAELNEEDERTMEVDAIGSTVPQSPVALAVHIFEQYARHTHADFRQLADGGWSNMTQEYRDAILDTITIHQLTQSIGPRALRPYVDADDALSTFRITQVPTACARFQHSGGPQPLDWQLTDRFERLVQSTRHRQGGRFAALERPVAVFDDVARFVRKLRKLGLEK